MEVRFFTPGGLVSNLDFVESIFGNAGDPSMPENDAGLDPEHWTGHTGCVILAPHLTGLTKKELGLPDWNSASERQRRDGMCWRDPGERYNEGQAFKVTCRDASGVIVTLIADNYFGYCKKEVKTQISYAANLFGNVEEEHSGGALAFAQLQPGRRLRRRGLPNRRSHRRRPGPPAPRGDRPPAGRARRRSPLPGPRLRPARRPRQPVPLATVVDAQRAGGGRAAAARQDLHDPIGVQGGDREASLDRKLAADRHGRRGIVLPQALHGFRRRQERDFQEPRRLHPARPDLRGRPGEGLRPGAAGLRPRLRRPLEAGPRA